LLYKAGPCQHGPLPWDAEQPSWRGEAAASVPQYESPGDSSKAGNCAGTSPGAAKERDRRHVATRDGTINPTAVQRASRRMRLSDPTSRTSTRCGFAKGLCKPFSCCHEVTSRN